MYIDELKRGTVAIIDDSLAGLADNPDVMSVVDKMKQMVLTLIEKHAQKMAKTADVPEEAPENGEPSIEDPASGEQMASDEPQMANDGSPRVKREKTETEFFRKGGNQVDTEMLKKRIDELEKQNQALLDWKRDNEFSKLQKEGRITAEDKERFEKIYTQFGAEFAGETFGRQVVDVPGSELLKQPSKEELNSRKATYMSKMMQISPEKQKAYYNGSEVK